MDFTIKLYTQLLNSLQNAGYFFQTFEEFINNPRPNSIVLRHDVDLLPHNSLRFANLQAKLGIKGSYYFRAIPKSWDKKVIKEISSLGHEVGYHYETMDTANGNVDKAWDQFRYNLDKLRKLTEVQTICMHGSPRSRFDNKDLWKKYDYRSLGIIGEPYFDVDFDHIFYLTDTGRRWDGWKTSVRDKVPQQEGWIKKGLIFHSTNDIIKAAKENKLPSQIMFTMHPQRWNDRLYPWTKELLMQNLKNQVKQVLIKMK